MSAPLQKSTEHILISQNINRSFGYVMIGMALFALTIYLLSPIIPAVLLAFLLYIALDPLAERLGRMGFMRSQSAPTIILLILISIGVVFVLGFSLISEQIHSFYIHYLNYHKLASL